MATKIVKVKVDVAIEVDDINSSNVMGAISAIFTENLEWNGVIKDWQYRKGKFNMKEIDIKPEDYVEGDAFD